MLYLCNFWRQSHEPAGAQLSRTTAPSLQSQLPLSLFYPPTVQWNYTPQGRLKYKPQRNHHTPRQGSWHTVRGPAKNQSKRQSSVCVPKRDKWENFYLEVLALCSNGGTEPWPVPLLWRALPALPALEALGCARGQPASHQECTQQPPLQPSRPAWPSASTESVKEGSEASDGPAHTLGPSPHPSWGVDWLPGRFCDDAGVFGDTPPWAAAPVSPGSGSRQTCPRAVVPTRPLPSSLLWATPAPASWSLLRVPAQRSEPRHSLAVPLEVGPQSQALLSASRISSLSPRLPSPRSLPLHTQCSLSYSLVFPSLLFWFSSTCSPNFL